MTNEEKINARREILIDVKERLDTNKLRIIQGRYIEGEIPKEICNKELQPNIDIVEASCGVCAKGAMFLSTIRKFNDYVLDSQYTSKLYFGSPRYDKYCHTNLWNEKICEPLLKYFDERELALIECAFEGRLATREPFLGEYDRDEETSDIVKDVIKAKEYYIFYGCKKVKPSEILLQIVNDMLANNTYFDMRLPEETNEASS